MKNSFIIFFVLLLSLSLQAQDKVKQKEIGLVFSGLNNVGVAYKTGTSKALWRFHTIFDNNRNRFGNSFISTASIGREFRPAISKKFDFRYGLDLSFQRGVSNTTYTNSSINGVSRLESEFYSPGANFVVGVNYKISKKFTVGVEMLPYIQYNIGKRREYHTSPSGEYSVV